jgi:hypothetical protein
VKRNGRLQGYDTRDIMRRAQQSADRIRTAAGDTLKL